MTPVAVVDWLALLAALIGLVVLLRGWANISSTTLRHTLAGLVLLVLFNGLSNSLQWSGITTAFDPFEDYTQLLIPLLYGLAVYDILRRRVEQDLQETAEQLRQERDLVQSITQTSPAGIILLNPQGEITYANRRAEEVLGKSLQELLGSECDLLECSEPSLDGDLATQVQVPCRLVAQTRRPLYDLRCSVCRPDGQQVYLAVNAAPLPDLSGALQGVVMTFEDVTQRVLAEGALFNEKERAQVTLHSIGDAVITTDAQARVEYLNPVAEALTGWTSTEARGMPLAQVFQVVKEQTRQPAPDPVARCLQGGKITGFMEHTVLISRGGK
jgi:PAS domain S-box-containing protein